MAAEKRTPGFLSRSRPRTVVSPRRGPAENFGRAARVHHPLARCHRRLAVHVASRRRSTARRRVRPSTKKYTSAREKGESGAGGLFNGRHGCYINRRGLFPRFPFSMV